jgi:hypothetical protein
LIIDQVSKHPLEVKEKKCFANFFSLSSFIYSLSSLTLSSYLGPQQSPYCRFPTYVAEPDFSSKGIERPALSDPLYGPHEQGLKNRALGRRSDGSLRADRPRKKKGKGGKKGKENIDSSGKVRPATSGRERTHLDPQREGRNIHFTSGVNKKKAKRPQTSTGVSRSRRMEKGEAAEEEEEDYGFDSGMEEKLDSQKSVHIPFVVSQQSSVTGDSNSSSSSKLKVDDLLAELEAAEQLDKKSLQAQEVPLIALNRHMIVNKSAPMNGGGKKKKKKKKKKISSSRTNKSLTTTSSSDGVKKKKKKTNRLIKPTTKRNSKRKLTKRQEEELQRIEDEKAEQLKKERLRLLGLEK